LQGLAVKTSQKHARCQIVANNPQLTCRHCRCPFAESRPRQTRAAVASILGRSSDRIIDDIGYVQQSPEEMEMLFHFLAERYEKKTVVITSNLGLFPVGPDLQKPHDDHGRH
jgi:energy-coupling factor transporter ATP-binding protein EcfA2